MATLTAPPDVLEQVATSLHLPEGAELLGPVPVVEPGRRRDEDEERLVLRVPRAAGAELSAVLLDLQRSRSARKQSHVRVEIDPARLG